MLARSRARLTYANVVATLALFVALGGSSYAITRIGSREVKNRSLRGLDLRRNTVTGKEVKESRLGTVPNALHAGSADTAGSAAAATVAADSQALGGLSPAAFEKSSRMQFGRAPQIPPSATAEQTLLDYPALGGRLTTAANDGCSLGKVGIKFLNLRTSGPPLRVYEDGLVGNVSPNSSIIVCSTPNNHWDGRLADSTFGTGLTLWFDCISVDAELRCMGIRSEP
jgi:hypothetical protein